MSDIKVSILTAVYNSSAFLSQAIESVINSSYSDWEYIIVDDCSTDNSFEIANYYAQKDTRIRTYRNEKNLGDFPNRNKVASYAKGKYLKYVDHDDMLYPNCLEIMVETMEKFPQAAMGVSQEVYEDYFPYPFILTPHETFVREFLKRGVLGFGPTTTMIRKDIFDEVGGFSYTRFAGDSELWFKITTKYPILKLQAGLIFWRKHEGQESLAEIRNPNILDVRYNYLINLLTNTNNPLNNDERIVAINRIKYRHARKILSLAFKNYKIKTAIRVFIKSNMSFIWLIRCLLFKS